MHRDHAQARLGVTRIDRVSKNPVVPAKVKVAFEIISNDPKASLQSAAEAAGLTTYRLRRLLKLPQVRKWIAEERRAQLDTICAANPEALRQIRDTSLNDVARVNSVKTLESLKELIDPSGPAALQRHSPGLIVQIINTAGEVTQEIGARPPPPLIDVTPEREASYDP
jgi:hypothetical protein